MYRRSHPGQLSFENFYLPFGGKLRSDNRWVKLAKLIPWEEFEQEYAQQFSETRGAPAKSFRMALGSLIIKEKLGTSDVETVAQITENPYLQYFLGMSEYQEHAPFEASMLVHFRQRLGVELVVGLNDAVVQAMVTDEALSNPETAVEQAASDDAAPSSDGSEVDATPSPAASDSERSDSDSDDDDEPPVDGQLILDATCAPADIRYPTDLNLLNDAREWSEQLIDALYAQPDCTLKCKPRTYRKVARQRYLAIARKRKPSRRLRRKGVAQQLRYLRRNLAHIDHLVAAEASLGQLATGQYRMLLVIAELYRQQREMYANRTHRIDHRIVSLAQPHVRPIVRGKAGHPVEFGAKLSLSCVNRWVFLDHLDWEAFNESTHLQQQAAAFRTRFGHYPASIHVDQIYRTRANRAWCKQRGIRLSGPPLGRPSSDKEAHAALKRQAKADEAVRVEIEGKFGQAKRRFGLGRVMAKGMKTAQTSIAITLLLLNLEHWLRCLWALLLCLLAFLLAHMRPSQHPMSPLQPLSTPWGFVSP